MSGLPSMALGMMVCSFHEKSVQQNSRNDNKRTTQQQNDAATTASAKPNSTIAIPESLKTHAEQQTQQ
jgi:hypothetical protein